MWRFDVNQEPGIRNPGWDRRHQAASADVRRRPAINSNRRHQAAPRGTGIPSKTRFPTGVLNYSPFRKRILPTHAGLVKALIEVEEGIAQPPRPWFQILELEVLFGCGRVVE